MPQFKYVPSGFAAEDCSISLKKPPEVFNVHQERICDSRHYFCSRILVSGKGFYNQGKLECSFRAMTVSTNLIRPEDIYSWWN